MRKVIEYSDEITAGHDNICEIYAIKDGVKKFELSRNGYSAESAVNVMSVTKSIMALLIGIAVDMGYIENASQKIYEFFPDYRIKRGERAIYDITIHHIMTMTAPYKYRSEPWTKVCSSDDWTKAAFDLIGGRYGINGEFRYSTICVQVLSGIIENASHMKLIDFANRFLFAPLSIPEHKSVPIVNKQEHVDFLMSKKPKDNIWISDPKGTVAAGWGLTLSACDMAKIGLLCLQKGVFNGKSVVSEKWIDKMTSPYYKCNARYGNMSYGYLWWIPDEKSGKFAAIGDGGNTIYVSPKEKLVVAVAATFKPRVTDIIEFIEKRIIPELER